jgi:peroxiredoxin
MLTAKAPFEIGAGVSDFTLTDTEGKEHRLSQYTAAGKTVVLEWFNPDCPFVVRHHKQTDSMAKTYAFAKEKDVVWLAVNSGAAGKQGNGLERNKKAREEYKIAYPVLLDEEGTVGKMFGAKTTPHMFVIGKDAKVAYMGAIDDDPSEKLGKTNYVAKALDELLAGTNVSTPETKAYGCGVKY